MDGITLLVADDEPIVRAFVKRFVQERNLPVARILEASNGREAIAQALEHGPDLMLLDIRMPGVDGLEAAEAIMEQRPDSCIVMVTAYDEFEYARSALRCGVSDYLLKPLDPEALARHVTAALAAKREKEGGGEREEGADAHPLVATVRRYVDAHLNETVRLEDIANAAHMSPSHCSRMFSRHAGVSLSDFITERRMALVVKLLETSFLSMTEIAGTVGFSSSAYFASWFKRAHGVSPLQYRKARAASSAGADGKH